MNVNYDLIGAFPEVEDQRFKLGETINAYHVANVRVKRSLGFKIAQAAGHFYGLRLQDFKSVNGLVDAILGLDQELVSA